MDTLIARCFPDYIKLGDCLKTERSYNFLVYLLLTNNYIVGRGGFSGETAVDGRLDKPKEYPYKIPR